MHNTVKTLALRLIVPRDNETISKFTRNASVGMLEITSAHTSDSVSITAWTFEKLLHVVTRMIFMTAVVSLG